MPRQRHYYGLNHLHFLTASTYHRARLFDSNRFCQHFVLTLQQLRMQQNFRVIGWVLMPEHFHLLLWPSENADPSAIMQSLKERTAKFILAQLRRQSALSWCAKMLEKLALPSTVHRPSTHRVWQRRFYDLNVWSPKKCAEKLDYMHANPLKRGLVDSPEKWPWSSFRFYFLDDSSILPIDRIL
ncbi:MAG TPA: transposase [Terriglobia bacterium]|nr:transposase [Terriglobia bacterium]